VLLAKEEILLQSMIDRLIEIGRGYETEMNGEPPPSTDYDRSKATGECDNISAVWVA
jgi:hypothetical protein